jgi:hypothetical protein
MSYQHVYRWQSRNGRMNHLLQFNNVPSGETPDSVARFMGWPGHSGTWLARWWDDLKKTWDWF